MEYYGCVAFLIDQIVDPSTLDAINQEFKSRFPFWTKIVYGLAVSLGKIETLGLLKRKIWAKNILIGSLLCVIVQMYHSLFIAGAIETFGATKIIFPGIIIFLALFSVWIADLHRIKGWFI